MQFMGSAINVREKQWEVNLREETVQTLVPITSLTSADFVTYKNPCMNSPKDIFET